jgi:deazaflavin-dependent oxidoreductase (nitroreductase family)
MKAVAVKKTKSVEFFWRIHPFLFKITGGRFVSSFGGVPICMLTTTGRKSGEKRTKALLCISHGDDFIVIASYAGEPRHPAWYFNLKANPNAQIQIRSKVIDVVARETEGEERETLWNLAVSAYSGFTEYKERTDRKIPVMLLERVR